jgi:hypothetical protein
MVSNMVNSVLVSLVSQKLEYCTVSGPISKSPSGPNTMLSNACAIGEYYAFTHYAYWLISYSRHSSTRMQTKKSEDPLRKDLVLHGALDDVISGAGHC